MLATFAKRAKWGTFTVYLVTGPDVEADVTDLLSDTRTGELATPAAGGIYWEQGSTLQGQVYWQAKRRYGQNVVVTWIGSAATKKLGRIVEAPARRPDQGHEVAAGPLSGRRKR